MTWWPFRRTPAHEHVWSAWKVTGRADIQTSDLPLLAYINGGTPRMRTTGVLIVQERVCQSCGFTEFNRQEIRA